MPSSRTRRATTGLGSPPASRGYWPGAAHSCTQSSSKCIEHMFVPGRSSIDQTSSHSLTRGRRPVADRADPVTTPTACEEDGSPPVVTDGSPRARDSRAAGDEHQPPLPVGSAARQPHRTRRTAHRSPAAPPAVPAPIRPVQHRLGPPLERPENTPDELRDNLRTRSCPATVPRPASPPHHTGCGFRCSPASHAESVHDYRRTQRARSAPRFQVTKPSTQMPPSGSTGPPSAVRPSGRAIADVDDIADSLASLGTPATG